MWEAHHVESQCMWAQAGASESDTHMLPQSAFRAEDAAAGGGEGRASAVRLTETRPPQQQQERLHAPHDVRLDAHTCRSRLLRVETESEGSSSICSDA
eukprot:CAMPEP_0195649158 /NCGR_PEP_ID=MMETSP0815-20121206/31033_1 /TAXON_ID=97485 /ORGANISM="Prymnesium parvum, Strain Texoma1" /LENGTH=97 /DNA_ID=CAMNT_0040792875 /DNA_START=42 /DNA_END=332 /DNA_ORIENTATION=-